VLVLLPRVALVLWVPQPAAPLCLLAKPQQRERAWARQEQVQLGAPAWRPQVMAHSLPARRQRVAL